MLLPLQGEYESWDARCVDAYLKAGGTKVIYVGERPENVRPNGLYPWGMTSSQALHVLLAERFDRTACIELPQWAYETSDVTVYVKR